MKTRIYLVTILCGLLTVFFSACNATIPTEEEISSEQETSNMVVTADNESVGQVLSTKLKRGCTEFAGGGFDNVGLAIEELAVDFTLKDTDGNEYTLSRLLGEKPVVMVFGSFT